MIDDANRTWRLLTSVSRKVAVGDGNSSKKHDIKP